MFRLNKIIVLTRISRIFLSRRQHVSPVYYSKIHFNHKRQTRRNLCSYEMVKVAVVEFRECLWFTRTDPKWSSFGCDFEFNWRSLLSLANELQMHVCTRVHCENIQTNFKQQQYVCWRAQQKRVDHSFESDNIDVRSYRTWILWTFSYLELCCVYCLLFCILFR